MLSIDWGRLDVRYWQTQSNVIPLHLFSEHLTVKEMQNLIETVECKKEESIARTSGDKRLQPKYTGGPINKARINSTGHNYRCDLLSSIM